jgi:hypothetical protein
LSPASPTPVDATPSSRRSLGALSRLAGGGVVVLLLLTPLAYAGTRPQPLHLLGLALHVVFGIWLLALLLERRAPRVNRLLGWAAAVLMLYFWVRGTAFPPEPVDSFTRGHWARIVQRWPESVILRTPAAITLLWAGLAGGFLVMLDLARSRRWRRAFHSTMIVSGLVVVALGLLQNATHARGIYWDPPRFHMPSPFFGPFYHFTSAGAFINLSWPPAACLCLYWITQYQLRSRAAFNACLCGGAALFILVGHAAHVSRLPQVLGFAALVAILLAFRPLKAGALSRKRLLLLAAALAVAVPVIGLTLSRTGRVQQIAARWKMLDFSKSDRPAPPPPPRRDWPRLVRDDLVVPYQHNGYILKDRGAAYELALKCVSLRPFFGFGPGGWISAVSQESQDPTLGTFYHYLQFTHEDYLQTAVEWGLTGALLLAAIGLACLYHAGKTLWPNVLGKADWTRDSAACFGALAALFAVLLQALIDFPLQIPANALYASALLALVGSYHPSQERRLPLSDSNAHVQRPNH